MSGLTRALSSFTEALLDLFFPPCCCGCGEDIATGVLCQVCAQFIEVVESPRCPCCGITFHGVGGDHLCGRCIRNAPFYQTTTPAFVYAGPIADGLRALKYGPSPERLSALARLWSESCSVLPPVDVALPVPLHPRKLRERGFNQTVLLAKSLLRRHGIKMVFDVLQRPRLGLSQAGLKGVARRAAPRGIYEVSQRECHRIEGSRVLLLDDVMTTGATANECARILRQAGASEVHVAVMARAMIES